MPTAGTRPARRCGKYAYTDEHEARIALADAVIARNGGQVRRRERRVYACERCGGWHLTSRTTPTSAESSAPPRIKQCRVCGAPDGTPCTPGCFAMGEPLAPQRGEDGPSRG